MHVVIGVWDMDPAREQEQRQGLERIVAGVSALPNLVKGYWCGGSDPRRAHTFIVFASQEAAEAFADDVRGNLANQAAAGITNLSLDVAEVTATT